MTHPMALVLGSLAALGILYSYRKNLTNENDTTGDKSLAAPSQTGEENMDRARSFRFFNIQKAWEDNKSVGNWPYSNYQARPPVERPYIVKGPPLRAGDIHWNDPSSLWLKTSDYKKQWQENYRNAYSTELASALQGQLVDGYWHELITKGELEIRPHLNLSRYK